MTEHSFVLFPVKRETDATYEVSPQSSPEELSISSDQGDHLGKLQDGNLEHSATLNWTNNADVLTLLGILPDENQATSATSDEYATLTPTCDLEKVSSDDLVVSSGNVSIRRGGECFGSVLQGPGCEFSDSVSIGQGGECFGSGLHGPGGAYSDDVSKGADCERSDGFRIIAKDSDSDNVPRGRDGSDSGTSVSEGKCVHCDEIPSDMLVHMALCHPLEEYIKPPLKKRKTARDGQQLAMYQFSLCHICGKGFDRPLYLTKHLQIHSNERKFTCHVCGKSFQHMNTMSRHSNIHKGNKQHKCSICGKGFDLHDYLYYHVKTHIKEKLFTCDLCGKKFRTQRLLNNHVKIHAKLKSFACEFCEKVFTTKQVAKTHMKSHVEIKSKKNDTKNKSKQDDTKKKSKKNETKKKSQENETKKKSNGNDTKKNSNENDKKKKSKENDTKKNSNKRKRTRNVAHTKEKL